MNVKVFGIRHHGPGSAKALLKALIEWQPDTVLIEGPPDADDLLWHVANEKLKPPVALLVYNPKDLGQASYIPFAEFSPEWQAIKWALKQKVAVRFMDLPFYYQFYLKTPERLVQQPIDFDTIDGAEAIPALTMPIHDPLSYIAQLAGYTDSERWWETTFEQEDHAIAVFDTILELMVSLRQELNRAETEETLYREAFMRQNIRQAQKEKFKKIAVVCGAWHAPVLADVSRFKEKNDLDLLKKLKKIPTATTWVPWSYDRLSRASGYGAGIISPAWYELLFSKRSHATARWMTKAARLMRKNDLSASSAHAIEAVRLAETLAQLRGRSIAGMDELEEAVLSILCEGQQAPMEMIRSKLIIGDVIGRVPPDIPQVPLQRDLEATIKSARLSKEYNTTESVTKDLDLRKDTHRMASHLLHRLVLLNIPWGKPLKGSQYQQGTFNESWKLQWKPDYAIRIIEAAQWGNTVEEATTNLVFTTIKNVATLQDLSALIEKVLQADIQAAIPALIRQLQEMAALTEDVLALMDALPPLANILRYGNVRGTDMQSVATVIGEMIPRISIGLPAACTAVDDDLAKDILIKITHTNHAINLLNKKNDTTLNAYWLRALAVIAESQVVHALLSGACVRILFDKNNISVSKAAVLMRYALSKGADIAQSAAWLEGFLQGSGLLLIHNAILWRLVDDWVDELDMSRLETLLPILRRTFSQFTPAERQKILVLAKRNIEEPPPQLESEFFDIEKNRAILDTLQLIF